MAISGFNRVLSWTDFTKVKGLIPGKPTVGATTNTGFYVKPWGANRTPDKKFVIKESTFLVTVEMNPGQSFVVAGRETPKLLQHEQGHYDISAIAARQIHKDALMLEADTERELRATFNNLFNDTFALWDKVQNVYDSPCATDHHLNDIQNLE
jgi:hypothetical protein